MKRVCASCWTITKNHCMMHGQQNVKSNQSNRDNNKNHGIVDKLASTGNIYLVNQANDDNVATKLYVFWTVHSDIRWSQWPRDLRRRSSAARLLRLWVRIPPGAWTFVCCKCCVLSGRGLCDGLITHPDESYRLWRVVACYQEISNTRRPATGLWKIQPQCVVTPGKQTTTNIVIYICNKNQQNVHFIIDGII